MSEKIKLQLSGAKPATPPAAGPEPSPEADPPTSANADPAPAPAPAHAAPSPDDDDDNPPATAAFPKEAVAALAAQRKQRKELKAQLKAVTEELGALKAQLAKPDPNAERETRNAEPESALPAPHSALTTPELTAAQEAVTAQEELRNWSRKESRALQHAIQNDSDATELLANLQAQVSKFGVALPAEPQAVLAWLDKVRTDAEDKLIEARFDVKFLQQQVEQQHSVLRSEGETFARTVAPKMFEAGTEEAKRFELIKQKIPGLEKHPLGMRFISAAVRGWEVIKGELEKMPNGAPANGAPKAGQQPSPTVALPAKPAAQLPGAPAVMPGRPAEGPEGSSSLFAKYRATLANPQATEQERQAAKQAWVRAGIEGR